MSFNRIMDLLTGIFSAEALPPSNVPLRLMATHTADWALDSSLDPVDLLVKLAPGPDTSTGAVAMTGAAAIYNLQDATERGLGENDYTRIECPGFPNHKLTVAELRKAVDSVMGILEQRRQNIHPRLDHDGPS